MMEIPEENIFEFDNIGYEKIEEITEDLKYTVFAL